MAVNIPMVFQTWEKGVIFIAEVLYLIGAYVVLLLASGVYVFVVACVHAKDFPRLDAIALQNTPYAPHSGNIAAAKEWLDMHNAQEISITSHDGLVSKRDLDSFRKSKRDGFACPRL